ncbi:MAG: TRAP transporter small permease subunit [Rhodovarius sp.]|nr:TRAP transporter small permease [Rhodovarius sp.]MCX7931270.1 TRAP transporter small permease [Rhodovarius sp.]MDW8315172.1 TRAP transporter small permease subunit [Rhodovarius sp.]
MRGEGRQPPAARLAAALAMAGGAVLLAAAGLTVVSGLLRWWTSQPVRGDFELVSVGSGLAVMSFLAWGAWRQANIIVDSFTTWLPAAVLRAIDAFWLCAFAGAMALLAWRMAVGGLEGMRSGVRTIGLLAMPYGWAIALGAGCFALTALLSLLRAWRVLRGGA